MAILIDKEKYILDLPVAKLSKEDHGNVSKTCVRTDESKQNFLHVLKPCDGMEMCMYNYVELNLR